MEIPESIAKLTTETNSDHFNLKPSLNDINLDEVSLLIKKSLAGKSLNSFETGLAFYKTDVSSERAIIKNILSLFSEQLVVGIKESGIVEEYKAPVITSIKQMFDSISKNIDSSFSTNFSLNKEKNFLDGKDFTLIILGYAIGLLKKIYNSRN